MNLLLDTHVAIWATTASHMLPDTVKSLLGDSGNTIHVSAASVWEISIKFRLGKAGAPAFSGRDAVTMFRAAGYVLLDISPDHAAAVGDLPGLHGDPFDRLLAAQALVEPMRLVTRDRKLAAYSDVTITW